MSKDPLQTARELIRARQYDEARRILNTLDHPAAQGLNRTVDGFAQQPRPIDEAERQSCVYPAWLPHHWAYTLVSTWSPVFRFESRHLRHGHTPLELIWLTRRWVGQMVGAAALLWVGCVLLMLANTEPATVYRMTWAGVLFAWVISLLDRFVLDFIGVLSALDSIQRDITDGRWELLCLTNLSAKHILHAKYAAAQIRIWRLTMWVVGARLGLVVFAALQLFVLPLIFPRQGEIVNLYRELRSPPPGSTADMVIFVVFALVALGVASGIYVVEPRWRLRVLAAASLAVSSQSNGHGFALLSALGAVLGVWVAQAALAAGALLIASFIGFSFFSGVTAGFCVNVYMLGMGAMIYNTYHSLATRWLNRAYQRLVIRGAAP